MRGNRERKPAANGSTPVTSGSSKTWLLVAAAAIAAVLLVPASASASFTLTGTPKAGSTVKTQALGGGPGSFFHPLPADCKNNCFGLESNYKVSGSCGNGGDFNTVMFTTAYDPDGFPSGDPTRVYDGVALSLRGQAGFIAQFGPLVDLSQFQIVDTRSPTTINLYVVCFDPMTGDDSIDSRFDITFHTTPPGGKKHGGGGGGPKTNCKKNGNRVLCPGQKKVVKKVVRTIRKTRAAAKPKAYKKASPQGKSARLQQLVDLSVRAQGLLDDWRKLKLATKNAAAKVYNDPFLNKLQGGAEQSRDAILDNIHRAQDGLAEFNYKLSKLGDRLYNSEPGSADPKTGSLAVILEGTVGELFPGSCSDFALYYSAECWHDVLVPQQKAATYSQALPELLDFEKAHGHSVTSDGNKISVDRETGEIVFQLYGSAGQGGEAG